MVEYLGRPVSPTTRNISLRYLKAFFNWCVGQGYLPANPTAGIRQAKLQKMLGHKSLAMTRRYVRLTQQDVKEAHEKASPVAKLASMGKRASRGL